jgi:ribosome-binding protein aMBF1 (putative translation factor)
VPEENAERNGKNVSGLRIREARERRQPLLTQDQLAGKVAALGVVLDRTAIAKIESGQRCVYDYELSALAAALNVDANWLLGTSAKRRR